MLSEAYDVEFGIIQAYDKRRIMLSEAYDERNDTTCI
jgi:hypothetical protein